MDGIYKLNLPVADSSREPLKLFRTMVKSLRLCDPMFAFARFMLSRNTATAASYDHRTRELVIDRVTARRGCEYEWDVHMAAYGEKAWITPAQAYSLVHGDCWTDEDRVTLTFVDGPHDHGRVRAGYADFDRLDSVSPPTMCLSRVPWGSTEGGLPSFEPITRGRRGQRSKHKPPPNGGGRGSAKK